MRMDQANMTMLGSVGRTALDRLEIEIKVQVAVAWSPSDRPGR